jgi:hypothetical protein
MKIFTNSAGFSISVFFTVLEVYKSFKGTVQRKLTRVVSYINREVFHSH